MSLVSLIRPAKSSQFWFAPDPPFRDWNTADRLASPVERHDTHMKTSPDIIPVFDKRDGADCASLAMKTWSEMGLRWNQYCDYSRSFYRADQTTPEAEVARLIADLRKAGKRIIAAAIHNYAVSVCVLPDRSR